MEIFDAETGELLLSWEVGSVYSYDLAYSPDGRRLATAVMDGVKIWNAQSGKELLMLRGHPGSKMGKLAMSYTVAFSDDGKRLAAGWGDSQSRSPPGSLLLWDVALGYDVFAFGGETEEGLVIPRQARKIVSVEPKKTTDLAGRH